MSTEHDTVMLSM